MALPEVKRSGYALSGLDVPPVGGATGPEETCAKLFTWIPPRPAMRLKPKPKGAEGGADGGADGEGEGADGGDAAEDEEPPPELPEETAEEAEARRCADPSSAPSDVILLKIADGGQHARSLKDEAPGGVRGVRGVGASRGGGCEDGGWGEEGARRRVEGVAKGQQG